MAKVEEKDEKASSPADLADTLRQQIKDAKTVADLDAVDQAITNDGDELSEEVVAELDGLRSAKMRKLK